jgi:hypothetical protein
MASEEENQLAGWSERMSRKWGVSLDEVKARVRLALKHKAEVVQLCGLEPGQTEFQFEDYFRDLLPIGDAKRVVYDPIQRMLEVDAEAKKKRDAGRAVLRRMRKK